MRRVPSRCLGLTVEPLPGVHIEEAIVSAHSLLMSLPAVVWVSFRFNDSHVTVYSSGGALEQPDHGKVANWIPTEDGLKREVVA